MGIAYAAPDARAAEFLGGDQHDNRGDHPHRRQQGDAGPEDVDVGISPFTNKRARARIE